LQAQTAGVVDRAELDDGNHQGTSDIAICQSKGTKTK
jgi:hypothetical protein